MPPWPWQRVSWSDPFQFAGLDYLGPIYVRGSHEMKKAWVCLFTCLTVRAVHLEWVMDLIAIQFLSCMKRSVSRRGKLDSVISDNAPQFKFENTTLNQRWRQILTDREVLNYSTYSSCMCMWYLSKCWCVIIIKSTLSNFWILCYIGKRRGIYSYLQFF